LSRHKICQCFQCCFRTHGLYPGRKNAIINHIYK
jgi:hypothetical protein